MTSLTPEQGRRSIDEDLAKLGIDIHAFEDNIDDDNYSTARLLFLFQEEGNVTGTISTKASSWDDDNGMGYHLIGQEEEHEGFSDEEEIQVPKSSLFSVLAKSITSFARDLFIPPNTSNRFTTVTLEELWKWNEFTFVSIGDIKQKYFWFINLKKIDHFSLDREMASRMSFFKKMMDPDISILDMFPHFPDLPFASWPSLRHRLPLGKRLIDNAEKKCKRELRYLYDLQCSHRKFIWLLQYCPGTTEDRRLRNWMFAIHNLRKIIRHAAKCVVDAMLGGEEGLMEYQKQGYYLNYKVGRDWKDSAKSPNYINLMKKGIIQKKS